LPVVSRKYLRQALGRVHLRDTYVGATTASWGWAAGSIQIIDGNLADLSGSGQNWYVGSTVYYSGVDVRVATFNVATGALLSQAAGLTFPNNIASGSEYERHDVLSGTEKNRALDDAVQRLRDRREVTIDTVADAHVYALPDEVALALGTSYFASPTATLDRQQRRLSRAEVVATATGLELRIDPALGASQEIVIDAIVTVSLGAGDAATVNIPDERLVLYAAEATCWDLMVRKAPRGTADEYRRLRDEAARQYSLLAKNFKVPVDRPLRLDNPSGQVF
jgi:hypothetical protein